MSIKFIDVACDPDLIAGARRGEIGCCEQIFRRFEQPVYTLAARLCDDQDEALDVMQETFIQVFTRIEQYRGAAPFWAWLRQIAVNACLNRLRKRKRLRPVQPETTDNLTYNDPGNRLDLAQALVQLPPQTRAILWLYDVEGYSHQEIASMFGRSVSFSKTQVSRAHHKLRTWLTAEQDDPCTHIITAN